MHPYLPQSELLAFCQQHKILITAYSPLGTNREPRLLDDTVVVDVAKRNGKTAAQVLISWAVQRGTGKSLECFSMIHMPMPEYGIALSDMHSTNFDFVLYLPCQMILILIINIKY
jgi:hypothetical protein